MSKAQQNVEKLNGLPVAVTEYGAIGDGVANDTTAIQMAINANLVNGSVFVPNGVFLIDPFVVTGAADFQLLGPGVLKVRSGNVCHAIRFSGASNVTINGIVFDGNDTNTTSNTTTGRGLLDFDAASQNVVVKNCFFKSAHGHSARYNSVIRFSHIACRHEDFRADPILVREASTDFLIAENTIFSINPNLAVGAHGINVEASLSTNEARRGLIIGNNINVDCAGIQLTNAVFDTTIAGNAIKASASNNGIKLDQTRTGVVVSNNTIYAGSDYGVFDISVNPPTIVENTIFAQNTYGIRSTVAGAIIKGNKIYGGIRAINVSANNCVITDNFISGPSVRGISAGDDTLISGAIVTNNVINGGTDGIYFRSTDGICAANTVLGTSQYPIYLINTTGSTFGPNVLRGNASNVYRSNSFGGAINNVFLDAAPIFDNIDTKKNTSVITVTETAVNIASAVAVINTSQKVAGKLIWDTTNTRLMRASGPLAADPWVVVDGSASVTPS